MSEQATTSFFRLIMHVFVLLALFCLPVYADEDEDYGDSRSLRDMGKVVSMDDLIAKIQSKYQGSILKVELDGKKHASGWRYKVKMLPADGNVLKLEYDAETLELLNVKGRQQKHEEDDEEDDNKSFWKRWID